MNGRLEKDNKVKERTLNRLKNQPEIISSYYYSMGSKTALTKDNYIRQIITFLNDIKFSGDIDNLKKIKPSDINKYLDDISINKKTGEKKGDRYIATIYFSISSFFDYLVNDGYLETNICKRVSPPHFNIETTPTYLTENEVKQVMEEIEKKGNGRWKSRDLLIFAIGCTTGLRISSISEMNIGDVDLDNGIIIVTEKGNKTRECRIGSKVVELFEDWLLNREHIIKESKLDVGDAVFITKYNSRMSIHAMEVMIKKYTEFLDKHITPHKLRHTCGTLLFQKEGNIKLVQEVLGHKNIANTMIYTHVSDELKQKAADSMDSII